MKIDLHKWTGEDFYDSDENLKKQDAENLLEWSKKQAHFPLLADVHIIQALHSSYYSCEAAKLMMENFLTVRAHCPEFFANWDPTTPEMKRNLDVVFYGYLPSLSPEGYTMCLTKFLDSEADHYNMTEQFKIFDMFTWLWWAQVGLTAGSYVIMDMKGAVFGHIKRIQLMAVRKYCYYIQEAMPIRLKGIHIINALPFVDIIFNMIKPFLKQEMIELVHFHPTMDTFYKIVPQKCMPKDYGGEGPTMKEIDAKEKAMFVKCKDFFEEQEILIADESKRIGEPKNAGDLFGVEGTFKKLDID